MKIGSPRIFNQIDQAVFEADIESSRGKHILRYTLDRAYSAFLTDSLDACLIALLMPAMELGEDIHLDGHVSERLLLNASGPLQALLKLVRPTLHKISISASNTTPDTLSKATGVATGFSAGVDSYCVLADYYFRKVPISHKITHLFFNNVGSHGKGGDLLFNERYARLLSVAERIGLPLIRVSSNLDDFYSKPYLNKRIGFQHSHTLRNTSAALLFQKGIGRYMYASALSYEDIHIRPNDDIAYCDPMTLPLLSTESQEIISVGSEHTRVQKTLIVTELQEPQTSLDVCIRPRGITGPINCSQCRKCLRTLATLEISGKIDRYRSIFDMDMWKRKRAKFFSEVMLRDFPLLKEIDNYAKETGFKYPIQSIAYFYTGLPYVYSRYNNARKRLKDLTKGPLKKSSYKNN